MRVLQYSVRLPILIRYAGQLLIVLAALSSVPFVVSLFFGDHGTALRYAIVITVISVLGIAGTRLRPQGVMQNNEAMVITAAIFILSPLAMTWPVMASGLDFSDALFECISAVTTTGLSTVAVAGLDMSTLLFSRAWMQWIGGLGIVVLCMAVLIQPGLTAKRLNIEESFEEDILGGTRAIARNTLVVYTAMTAAGIIVLMVTGVHWYDALLYSLTAISTGGFAPYSGSLAGLPNVLSQFSVIAIAIGGATSLLLFSQIYERGWRKFFLDSQLQAFIATAVVIAAALTLVLWLQHELSLSESLRHGILNGLSALSTAGFSSTDIGGTSNGSKLILILAMAVGGCAGSTAGGIKIIRLLILFRLLYLLIQKAAAPSKAVLEARLNGRKLGVDEMLNAVTIFVLFNIITMLSWLPFLTAGHPPLDSLFEVVSALGTVGLSSGITSIELPVYLKGILCINMLLGRLEIVAWLVFFYPGTWIGKRKED